MQTADTSNDHNQSQNGGVHALDGSKTGGSSPTATDAEARNGNASPAPSNNLDWFDNVCGNHSVSDGSADDKTHVVRRAQPAAPATTIETPTPLKVVALKSRTHRELKDLIKNAPGDLIEGLIPEDSVNLFAGDSGLGKTPMLAQMGLCVSAGLPFLGQKTRRGIALYVDYENGGAGFDLMLDKLGQFLGLAETPDTFRHLHQPASIVEVTTEIKNLRALYPELPMLVIVDALRGFDNKAESKSELASQLITKMEKAAKEYNFALLLLHHLRKEDLRDPLPSLMEADIMDWLQRVSGARALVNQSLVRIGIDAMDKGGKAELVIKGHYKIRGPFGPLQIVRVYDEEGEPIGYERLTGVDLLSKEQQAVLCKLPDEFAWKQVESTSGKNPKIIAEWLRAWQSAGVVKKQHHDGRTKPRYRKVADTSKIAAEMAEKAKQAANIAKVQKEIAEAGARWQQYKVSVPKFLRSLKPGDEFDVAQLVKSAGVQVEDAKTMVEPRNGSNGIAWGFGEIPSGMLYRIEIEKLGEDRFRLALPRTRESVQPKKASKESVSN